MPEFKIAFIGNKDSIPYFRKRKLIDGPLTPLKKLISILIIVICLMQSGGMTLLYQFRISTLKSAAESILRNKDTHLEKLILPLETYSKSKVNQDEISYQGKMYDIRTISVIGNKVEILAYHDKPEEHLVNEFLKLFTKDKRKNPSLPDSVQKLIASIFIIPATKNEIIKLNTFSIIYRNYNEGIIGQLAIVFSPPPDKA